MGIKISSLQMGLCLGGEEKKTRLEKEGKSEKTDVYSG